MPRTCVVVDDSYCEGETNKKCFACDQPACENCTLLIPWFGYGVKRVCFSCAGEEVPDQVRGKRLRLLGYEAFADVEGVA